MLRENHLFRVQVTIMLIRFLFITGCIVAALLAVALVVGLVVCWVTYIPDGTTGLTHP
jgi:hypothetical protein